MFVVVVGGGLVVVVGGCGLFYCRRFCIHQADHISNYIDFSGLILDKKLKAVLQNKTFQLINVCYADRRNKLLKDRPALHCSGDHLELGVLFKCFSL